VTSRNPDLVGAVLIAVLALVVFAGGVTTPDPEFWVVSPAVLPALVGVLMLVSAVWLAVDALRGSAPPKTEPIDRQPFISTIVATLAFLLAFVPLGFILSATAFLIAQARILGSRHILRDSIASVLFVAALYLLFVQGLTIALPKGPLPF
jgi:hypothetical protein